MSETQSGETKAMEIGFGTPKISVNVNWADDIMDIIIKKYFYQK
jgi:hypothetical protein